MVAVRNYITERRTQLSFHKGDIIKLQRMDGLESGETDTKEFHCNLSISVNLALF